MDKYSEDVDLGINQEMNLYAPTLEKVDKQSGPNRICATKLRKIIEQQEEIVCHKMHKAMSPISAISGYLELMKMLLDKGADQESLKHYRDKVEEGVDELGEIVEDLYNTFDHESGEAA